VIGTATAFAADLRGRTQIGNIARTAKIAKDRRIEANPPKYCCSVA